MSSNTSPERTGEHPPLGRSYGPLRALISFIRPYSGTLAIALLTLIVASGALLALPIAVRYVIDVGLVGENGTTIDRYFLWLLGATALFGIFSSLRFFFVSWLGERVVADIRNAVYGHILRMDPAFFEVTQTGEVLSRLTTDTTLIQSISGVGISIALRSSLQLAGGLVMLTITSPRLTGMIIVLVPLVIVPIILIGRRVRVLSRTSQDRIADTSGMAGETLNAIQIVQAFTSEEQQSLRFADVVKASFIASVRRIRVRALMTATAILLLFTALIVVLRFGAHEVLAGDMTAGQLGQFVLYAMFVATAAASLSEMWGEVQRAAGAAERLMELLNAQPAIVAVSDPVEMPEPGVGSIRFEHVHFCYPSRPGEAAMYDFSLDITPGETVAFVGPSGAGKSTTFQLLLRFYDPASGCIKVDGVDIATARPEDVRRCIGLVPQETTIFGATARENIRFGNPAASDEQIEAAARAAAAHEFIKRLPEGYETFLGERGTRLSGGQKQRMALARAILKDPPILLLDEATSSLDAESERVVQEALEVLMMSRTTIIIAHRLATVLKADRIVVMDRGRIVDIGRHEEIARRNPLYARLAELQFGEGYEEIQRRGPG